MPWQIAVLLAVSQITALSNAQHQSLLSGSQSDQEHTLCVSVDCHHLLAVTQMILRKAELNKEQTPCLSVEDSAVFSLSSLAAKSEKSDWVFQTQCSPHVLSSVYVEQ